jgi:electron transport complex protein RnfD
MPMTSPTLVIRHSPHLHSGTSVDAIMRRVVVALLPACGFAVIHFGVSAFWILLTSVLSCLLTEHLGCWLLKRPTTINDYSATITGLLYGMTLPPSLPLWMVFLGGVVAIGIGKLIFGGLGQNPFNPALVGRAFLQAAFPFAMTSWPPLPSSGLDTIRESTWAFPLTRPQIDGVMVDGVSMATPLRRYQLGTWDGTDWDLVAGNVSGCVGETSGLMILIGGIYLVVTRSMNWRIPIAIFLTVGLSCAALNLALPDRCPPPLFVLFSGGLMLGAVFMATDMVASPVTQLGCVIYGMFIGAMIVILRVWGGMPEGVMYAILLGNAVSPLIDRSIQPLPFGATTGWRIKRLPQ